MYTKDGLMLHMEEMGIDPRGTLQVHSSMKAIGEVEGGADTVLDALMEYMKDGLLLMPAHTWKQIGPDYPVFDAAKEPSCVGLLSNMFMKRPGVIRSLHPTHSMSAFGKEAEEYVRGEEKFDTPCPREGCWGRLFDRRAQVILIGCGLNRYTFVHSVEEWLDVPGRLTEEKDVYTVVAPDGARHTVLQRRQIEF